MIPEYVIRQQYKNLVKRYENEKDLARKIEMKHKFIHWIKYYSSELTNAEIEYLQECICRVEDLYW